MIELRWFKKGIGPILALISYVDACAFTFYPQNPTSYFSDLSIPRTLLISETVQYTSCTETVTHLVTLYVNGVAHFALPVIFTFYSSSQPLTITYTFPDVTLSTLTASQTVLYQYTDAAADDPSLTGRGFYSIVVPQQANAITTPTASSTSFAGAGNTGSPTTANPGANTSAAPAAETSLGGGGSPQETTNNGGSSGLSGGAIGGIVGGVLGGLLIIGLLLVILWKKMPQAQRPVQPPIYADGPAKLPEQEPKEPAVVPGVEPMQHTPLRYLDPDDPVGQQHLEPAGARLRPG